MKLYKTTKTAAIQWLLVIKNILLSSLFVCASAYGNFENHLKEVPNKGDHHHIRNIDFIYMINLDARPEKWQRSINQLAPFGIYPYRFSAVWGWELGLDVINDVGVKLRPGMQTGEMASYYPLDGNGKIQHEPMTVYGRTYFCHCLAKGPIGICLSHLSVIKDALDSGYKTIWVMEDDVDVMRDPNIISDLIELLDREVGRDKWDILFTDQDYRNNQGEYLPCTGHDQRRPNLKTPDYLHFDAVPGTDQVRRVAARFGATSMIIRRSGMQKLLTFFRKYDLYFPYDIDFAFPKDIALYSVTRSVVTNLADALSDNGTYLVDVRKKGERQ